MAGLSRSLPRRLRSEKLLPRKEIYAFPDSLPHPEHRHPHGQQQLVLCAERSRIQLWSCDTVQVETSTRHQDVIHFGRYIVHEVPEAKPAILLAWADNSDDLAAIKAAGQVPNLVPTLVE